MSHANYEPSKEDLDNHANQLNPNNEAYYDSRDEESPSDDWEIWELD